VPNQLVENHHPGRVPSRAVARGHALRCYEIRSRELLRSPDFYPLKMDFDNGTISFVPMSRATYKVATFLDGRIQPASPKRYDIPTAEIPPALNPVHYIFHAALCCSTLLARYLERLKGAALPDTDGRRQAERDCSAGDCLSLM
jgi:hypothetical protein